MTKEKLQSCIAQEKELYLGSDKRKIKKMRFTLHKRYLIWKYLYFFRLCRFYAEQRAHGNNGPLKKRIVKLKHRYYDRKRNQYSALSGVEIGVNSDIGICPDIWHGGVIVNGTLGDHCILHGNNVIGNKRSGDKTATPVIGSNVDIGAGAIIIGGVEIADQCIIGAGAVVTRSFYEPGCVLAGVPAKELAKKGENE